MSIEYPYQFKFYEAFKSMGPKLIQMKNSFPSSVTLFNTFCLQPYTATFHFHKIPSASFLEAGFKFFPLQAIFHATSTTIVLKHKHNLPFSSSKLQVALHHPAICIHISHSDIPNLLDGMALASFFKNPALSGTRRRNYLSQVACSGYPVHMLKP